MTAALVGEYDDPGRGPPPAREADVDMPAIIDAETGARLSFGDVVADRLTREIGSWRFIGIYFVLLLIWIAINTTAWIRHWDPYPFIFLNLVLSFQGAFAAPIILMSQNRQEERDRLEEQRDHAINLRAEREVADLQALGKSLLDEITALRAEQAVIARQLDATLTAAFQENASDSSRSVAEDREGPF